MEFDNIKKTFDFYNPGNVATYDLSQSMRYQLQLLDNLDHLTRKHSENVANITCRICEYLKCKRYFTVYATMCAYLHDIGKVFVPHEILYKNGKLTDEEYEIMKNHTVYGYNLCKNDPKLKMFAEATLYHHECLDGSGYPNGVKGNKIPFASQIIHVADVYDALVTKRHYTTHVNISQMLVDLISDSNPSHNVVALDELKSTYKHGKINKKALRALFNVVIDDTEYEIYNVKEYVSSIKDEINRLKQVQKYDNCRQKQKSPKKIKYYEKGMKMLLTRDETFDNYQDVLLDYKRLLKNKVQLIDDLYKEIKIIKKLKV